jgi:uncharacterized membrane protein
MTPTGRLASVGARLVPTTPSSKFARVAEKARGQVARGPMRSFICAALLTNHGFTISVFVAVAITATFAFVFEAPPELVATVLVLGILTARGFNSASGIPHSIYGYVDKDLYAGTSEDQGPASRDAD